MQPRTAYQQVSPQTLRDMNSALELVGGSFVAAAKLLDMTPTRFRNLVYYHKCLHEKWAKKRGRPSNSLKFRVIPCHGDAFPPARMGLDLAKLIVGRLSENEQRAFKQWLEETVVWTRPARSFIAATVLLQSPVSSVQLPA
jgi:hypothetical protein